MSGFPTGTMDDAGFMTARATGVSRPAAGTPDARPPRPAKARRRNGLAWGVAAAAGLHVAMLTPLVLARPELRDRLTRDEPMTIYIEMARPPAPPPVVRRDRPKAETPPPPVRAEPLPFTPRESVQPPTPPPVVSPFTPPRPDPAPVRAPEPRADAAPAEAPPAPPAPGPSSTAVASAFNDKVIAALARARRYPPDARARREEGTAMIAITLNRSGRVLNAEITRGSGSKSLDRAALETARRAAMPRVPAELSDPVRVVVALEFALK